MFISLSSALRTVLFTGLGWYSIFGAQAATMGQLPYIPTRFHLCSTELDDLEGDARDEEMRACLNARFHAEKAVRSQCSQQVKQMRPAPRNADERYRAQRDCFIQHLTLSYKDLPPSVEHKSSAAAPSRPKATASATSPTQDPNHSSATEELSPSSSSSSAASTAHPAVPPASPAAPQTL